MTAPVTEAPVAVTGIRVLNTRGEFGAPTRVGWEDGTFLLGDDAASRGAVRDGTGLYMTPGLVDAHAHVSWHAFAEADRARDTLEARDAATTAVLSKMLHAGFTSVRDAGGFEPQHFEVARCDPRNSAEPFPRIQASVALIGREAADAAGSVIAATEYALERGARWIKLIGTDSVASKPAASRPGADLEPHFTAGEQRAVVARAAEVGAGVMLHAWGGSAIDDAIDSGVMSIEHGIFMTAEQSARAADAGMTFVPTLLIYRHVQRMIAEGKLPAAFANRVDEAVAAHPASVRAARDAGLPIALGTDFATPAQHGTNRAEFDALVSAGLSHSEAMVAATHAGAQLMARVADRPAPSGRIADGEIADAVIFRRDPLAAPETDERFSAFSDPHAIVAVIIDGHFIDSHFSDGHFSDIVRPDETGAPHPETSRFTPDVPLRKDTP